MSIDYQQDYFAPRSIVQCTTCLGETIKGEVEAFEPRKKLLILKSCCTGGKQLINVVNLALVKDISVLKEPTSQQLVQAQTQQSHVSHNFNHAKIQRRKLEAIEKKRRSIAPVKINAEGQTVFMAIRKTLDDARWEGESIIVFEKVTITAPYTSNNVQFRTNKNQHHSDQDGAVIYVRKVLDKVWSDFANVSAAANKSTTQQNATDVSETVSYATDTAIVRTTVTATSVGTVANATVTQPTKRNSPSPPQVQHCTTAPGLIVKHSKIDA